MGALGVLIEAYTHQVGWPISDRALGKKLSVTGQTVGNWRKGTALPSQENLRALADLMRADYGKVLDAALRDSGYLGDAPVPVKPKTNAQKAAEYHERMHPAMKPPTPPQPNAEADQAGA